MRRVIVTGDDFGFSPAVNAGILRAHQAGVLRGTSLMVTGAAHAEAAAMARENPGLDAGLHLVVCRGESVLAPARLAGAVDGAGRFRDSPVLAGMTYFFNRRIRAAMRDEYRAQIETHLRLTGYLNHIDGHLNFHVHPAIADTLVALAVEYHVPCMRIPREPVLTTILLARDHVIRKLTEGAIFRLLSRRMRRKMRERGLLSTDWLFGLHQSGNWSERYLTGVIGRLREGVTELYFHPAAATGAADAPSAGQREVALLASSSIRAELEKNSIVLTNFAELARAAGKNGWRVNAR
ncbi:MAG: hopanoid biosynthesis-associated protein HpnK [Candidatus Binataceae bacterium]